jgi:hypothetical protein
VRWDCSARILLWRRGSNKVSWHRNYWQRNSHNDLFRNYKTVVLLIAMLFPTVTQVLVLVSCNFMKDSFAAKSLFHLPISWFTWPSIEKIVEARGVIDFEKTRLNVFLSLGTAIMSVVISSQMITSVRVNVRGAERWQTGFSTNTWFYSFGFIFLILFEIFLLPGTYTQMSRVDRFTISSDLMGLVLLGGLVSGLSFFLMPLAIYFNLKLREIFSFIVGRYEA